MFPGDLLPNFSDSTEEMVMVRSEVDRRRDYFKQMDLRLPMGSKHPLVDLAQECLQDDPAQRPKTEEVVGRLRQMVEEAGRIPDERDAVGRMEVIKLLHQQDSLHTMMPKEKEEVRGNEGGEWGRRERGGGGRGGREEGGRRRRRGEGRGRRRRQRRR